MTCCVLKCTLDDLHTRDLDCLHIFTFQDGSLGTISALKQTAMQWFALALLNGRLPYRNQLNIIHFDKTYSEERKTASK